MPRPIRGIDIYLPLDYNDGRPIEESKYLALQQELLERFGGVTSVQRQFPLQGLWQAHGFRIVAHVRLRAFSLLGFNPMFFLFPATIGLIRCFSKSRSKCPVPFAFSRSRSSV